MRKTRSTATTIVIVLMMMLAIVQIVRIVRIVNSINLSSINLFMHSHVLSTDVPVPGRAHPHLCALRLVHILQAPGPSATARRDCPLPERRHLLGRRPAWPALPEARQDALLRPPDAAEGEERERSDVQQRQGLQAASRDALCPPHPTAATRQYAAGDEDGRAAGRVSGGDHRGQRPGAARCPVHAAKHPDLWALREARLPAPLQAHAAAAADGRRLSVQDHRSRRQRLHRPIGHDQCVHLECRWQHALVEDGAQGRVGHVAAQLHRCAVGESQLLQDGHRQGD